VNEKHPREQGRKTTDVRRREIVDAAIRIIALDGPRSFTAKNIAAEVGITSGAIFRHFENMEAIVDLAVERMDTVLSGDFPVGATDPLEKLKTFFLNRTNTIASHPHISRLLLSDHLAQAAGSEAGERLESFKKRSRAFIVRCLREAERAGGLANGVTAETGAVLVLGAILALSHAGTRVVRKRRIEPLSEEVWPAIERVLGARSQRLKPTKVRASRKQRRRKSQG
jgi:AcrR family transcriptional regulator